MLSLSLLAVCAAGSLLCSAMHVTKPVYLPEDYEKHFEEFILKYNRTYASKDEKQMRFEIFKQNLEDLNEQNSKSTTAVFGITFGTDLTTEEFLSKYTGLKPGNSSTQTITEPDPLWIKAPAAFDWRDHNRVTSVKNQFGCGACWTFSAMGNLESQYAIKNNIFLDLSEQQLLDCSHGENDGCNGGHADVAAQYLIANGAELSSDYPYTGKKDPQPCQYDQSKVKVQPTSFNYYTGQSEDVLKDTLYNVGPLSVSLAGEPLRGYNGGILTETCSDSNINHAVLLIGYGTESGIPYWIIKNSWGDQWGEEGYGRFKYGVNCLSFTSQLIGSIVL